MFVKIFHKCQTRTTENGIFCSIYLLYWANFTNFVQNNRFHSDEDGVKNTSGQWVVKPIYDEIMYMEEDLIAAKKDGWYGFARLNSHKDEIHLKYEIEYETED